MSNIKKTICLIWLLLCGLATQAQVQVQVNGSQTFVINENNGLYFHGDSMLVDNTSFPLSEVQVITLRQITDDIDDIAESELHLMPNPVRDAVVLQGIGDAPLPVAVYSLAGVKLMEQLASDGTSIDISRLPQGLYLLRCGNKVSKIVKQ